MKGATEAGKTALLAFFISFAVLVLNGRAIGSGDTNAMEQTAAALAERGTFVLPPDEGHDPFTRPSGDGRVSIYPALPALLAAPFFFGFGLLFDLNPSGIQVAGKLSAAFIASAAISLLAWSFSKRATPRRALVSALLFGIGTSVYSTAQALWQHPAVVLFMVIAISALEQMERAAEAQRVRAGLIAAFGLSLAIAARPAVIPMCLVLCVFLLLRERIHAGRLIATFCVPLSLVALYNTTFFGAPWRFGPALSGRFLAAFPESIGGLLVSPARGFVVFTSIALLALIGLVSAARRASLARALLIAVATHFLFMSTWNEWHGGESFGPRLLTDLLPALFFFLPEALRTWPKTGAALGALSVAVQLLGGLTYDYRWERLHQRGREFDQALWSWRDSPIAFAAREGVVIQGTPEFEGRRVRLRLRRSVPFGPPGSRLEATTSGLRISGPALVKDIRLERGAQISAGRIRLSHPADALAFRSEFKGTLSLHLVGFLNGVLRIETPSAQASVPLSGEFDRAQPLQLAVGDDVFIRAESGELRLSRIEVRP